MRTFRPSWRPRNPMVLPIEMLLATLVYAGFQLSTGMVGDTRDELVSSPPLIAASVVALLAMTAVTCVRRSFPVTAYLSVVAISIALILVLPDRTLGFTPLYWFAIAALAIRVAGPRLFAPIAVGLILEIAVSVDTGPGGTIGVVVEQIANLAINYTVLIALGKYIARGRAQELESEAALGRAEIEHRQRLNAALDNERKTMARELHDVAAHHLTGMLIQAKASRTLITSNPEQARELITGAIGHGQRTLDSLRQIVGILRPSDTTDSSFDTDSAPQPMISDIAELIEQSRISFGRIEMSIVADSDDTDSAVQLTCYRIVQESLSNARRHAPNCDVRVEVSNRSSAIEVTVTNTITSGSSEPDEPSGQGFGIPGMRERAALLGGTLDAGLSGDRATWTVRARLPIGGKISRPLEVPA
ncbi:MULTISPECIES: histidine kinase [unclassified Rhodococcus (in: high G+C Gram-positive bacteria)]|uniref:sensor histidine kinase n=1 Tax=unclassified Rhodococcus (in: high G+C Gram-positive bacteria) TaxID=192944 RepID=UPI00165DB230|nr:MULTISPECIES: histidine kinase [unclassified Rhodococcus (in: high G+C Gram-positive bacteria)]MDI9927655.1 histidine kinase [Rhodococcus sp. IEGM 1341]